MAKRRVTSWIFMLVPIACASPLVANASRPLVTDDASILDAGACQLEAYHVHDRNGHQWGAAPACNPLGSFEVQLDVARTLAEGQTFDHTTVQLKTVFRSVEPDDWGIGLVAGIQDHTRPRSSRRFGHDYVRVPATFALRGDSVLVHVNAGVDRNRYDSGTHLTWGAATEISGPSRVTFFGETFGAGDGTAFWQAGARFDAVPQRLELNAAVGAQWRGNGDARWWTLGLRLTTPSL